MITEFLIFGGVFFWLFVAVVALFVISFFANESPSGATVSILVAMTALALFSDINPFKSIWESPLLSVFWLTQYLLVGVFWAVVKWRLLLSKIFRLVEVLRPKYATEDSGKWSTEKSFLEHKLAYDHGIRTKVPPKAATFKSSIYCWLFYWPLSFLQTLFGDMLRKGMAWIYNRVTTVFDRMSGSMFADYSEKP